MARGELLRQTQLVARRQARGAVSCGRPRISIAVPSGHKTPLPKMQRRSIGFLLVPVTAPHNDGTWLRADRRCGSAAAGGPACRATLIEGPTNISCAARHETNPAVKTTVKIARGGVALYSSAAFNEFSFSGHVCTNSFVTLYRVDTTRLGWSLGRIFVHDLCVSLPAFEPI